MNRIAVLLIGVCLLSCAKTTNTESESVAKPETPSAAPAKVEPDVPKIHALTVDVKGVEKNEVKTKTLSTVDDAYFEISLWEMSDNTSHEAKRDIITPESLDNFHYKFMEIVDINTADTAAVKFQEPTEFLNFMDKHGYEMVDQKKIKHHIEYTFKKK